MRRFDATDEDDVKEAARLNAEPWMLELLAMNPSYVSWGPYEDYMAKGEGKPGDGWDARVISPSWKEFGPFGLDDLNEVVNFYFEIERESERCAMCNGESVHPDGQWIANSFYPHSSPFTVPDEGERQSKAILERFGCKFDTGVLGRGTLPPDEVINRYGKPFLEFCVRTIENGGAWHDDITEDEATELVKAGRGKLDKLLTAEDFNDAERDRHRRRGFCGHDAINRWILIEQRCKRLGVPHSCPQCEGHGHTFTTPNAHVNLILWVLHPRKGCSRGVEVRITRANLPEVFAYLNEAAQRNAQRFSKIPVMEAPQCPA